MALKGWWGRAAREAEACRGGLPWPSAQSMSLQQPSALSFKPATDRPAHLVMSVQGHEAVKAAIYTLATIITLQAEMTRWNVVTNHLAGSSDHLKCPRLSTASASAPLLRGMAAERGGHGQGPGLAGAMGDGGGVSQQGPGLCSRASHTLLPISGEPAKAGTHLWPLELSQEAGTQQASSNALLLVLGLREGP